jgi:hypothetical protein
MNALPNPTLASSPANATTTEPAVAQPPARPPRLPFVPPLLTNHGTVAAITQFGGSGIEPLP